MESNSASKQLLTKKRQLLIIRCRSSAKKTFVDEKKKTVERKNIFPAGYIDFNCTPTFFQNRNFLQVGFPAKRNNRFAKISQFFQIFFSTILLSFSISFACKKGENFAKKWKLCNKNKNFRTNTEFIKTNAKL